MDNKQKISYEPEADVLRVEVSKQPIDYAKEIGNFVVHFSKDDQPVYLEILEAAKFQRVANQAFKQSEVNLAF